MMMTAPDDALEERIQELMESARRQRTRLDENALYEECKKLALAAEDRANQITEEEN